MPLTPVALAMPPTALPTVTTHEERRGYASTPPAYAGSALVLGWSESAASGPSVKFSLLDLDDAVRHPFKGIRWGSKPGDGQRLRVSLQRLDGEGNVLGVVYADEASLAWWEEDCANGVQVKVLLSERRDGVHPMKYGNVQSGKDGEVLLLAVWVLGDDDLPEPPPPPRRGNKVPFAQMDATRQAAIKCSDPEFREWCSHGGVRMLAAADAAALPSFAANPEAFAAEVVRLWCGVASRSAMRQQTQAGEAARARWAEMLRRFGRWRSGRPEAAR
jgi:hypothetical protein